MYFYNARYYDSALGRFIQADTIVPSPANPQSLNRYSYTLNNPLRYTDPSGYFSEEQLNWMGYYQDQVTAELWELLLLLEPDDYLELLGSGNAGSIAIGHRGAGSRGAKWGLYAVSDAGATELLDWIGRTSVENIQVTRQIGTGEAAWNYSWRGISPQLAHTMWQTGFIQSEGGARFNRLFSASLAELRDFLIGLIPGGDVATAALGIGGAWSLDGGDLPGDVLMDFAYLYPQTQEVVARSMWLRLSTSPKQSGLMVTLSNEWRTVSLPPGMSLIDARRVAQRDVIFE